MPAPACSRISRPSVVITALSGGPPSTRRMSSRSMRAPSTRPEASAVARASQYDPPCHTTLHARNVVNISMPPVAKFTMRVARQISTRASATAANTMPSVMPARVRLTKRSISAPQVGVAEPVVAGAQPGVFVDGDRAEVQDDGTDGDGQGATRVLLELQDGQPR